MTPATKTLILIVALFSYGIATHAQNYDDPSPIHDRRLTLDPQYTTASLFTQRSHRDSSFGRTNCMLHDSIPLTFQRCLFSFDSSRPNPKWGRCNGADVYANTLTLHHCRFTNALALSDISLTEGQTPKFETHFLGSLNLLQDTFPSLNVNRVRNLYLVLGSSYLDTSIVKIDHSDLAVRFAFASSRDSTLDVRTSSSSVRIEFATTPALKKLTYWSSNDTVKRTMFGFGNEPVDVSYSHSYLTGTHSFFRGDPEFDYNISNSRKAIVTMEDCTLNSHAFIGWYVDTIFWKNCTILPGTRLLTPPNGSKKILWMNIRQTDLSNLQIDWTDRTRLTFSIEQTTDEISATYQALLDKFKKEVREESYKYLDIQYQDYRLRRRGIIGIAWSNLNEWWWNYGYDKNLILRHTLELLGLFFIINLLLGKKLFSFYPIIRFDPGNRWARPYRFYTRYLIRVFLLTLLIFFSIRVDFNRIDSSRTRMLLYFFVQYFLGLLCLFFLFNALLKIG